MTRFKFKIKIDWQTLQWRDTDSSLGYVSWLRKNVGSYIDMWDYDDFNFYFHKEEDAMMFALRWA